MIVLGDMLVLIATYTIISKIKIPYVDWDLNLDYEG